MDKLNKYIERIKTIDWMIRHDCANNSKVIAQKLNISDRQVFHYLQYMRTELAAPIKYNRSKLMYEYSDKKFVLSLNGLVKSTKYSEL